MVGSFSKLYESVENLDFTYMQPQLNKDILLKPKAPVAGPNILGLLANVDEPAARNKVFYMCSNSNKVIKKGYCSSCGNYVGCGQCSCSGNAHRYVTEDPNEQCPQCNQLMSSQATYVCQPKSTEATSGFGSAAGYVKGLVTYMIMDDLEVKPISTISSITMLNRFNVKDVGALEEKVVELGMNEAVKLLKESLQSKEVLTNVFLGKEVAA